MSTKGNTYHNALEFWKYDADTGSGSRAFAIKDDGKFEANYQPFASCAWDGDRTITGDSGGCHNDIVITCRNNNISHMKMACNN
jgi:hypothetical protein